MKEPQPVKKEERDLDRERVSRDIEESGREHFYRVPSDRRISFETCGGGRRVIRKRIGD